MARDEFEMTEEQLNGLLEAAKPAPYTVVGGLTPRSPQENANSAWAALGTEMGFKSMTVLPISGKSDRFFTAESVLNQSGGGELVGNAALTAELLFRDYERLKAALRRYASHQPLDLKTPRELQKDLLAIAGDSHSHQSSIGDSSACLICGRDLRNEVHHRATR